jgi:ferredoxin--NADP+ reductase
MAMYTTERVIAVRHWSDSLFSFRTTRSAGLRFDNGQFVMLGLDIDGGRRLVRAYSIASANHEDHLEFYSIKVPDGPLTSRLRHIRPGSVVSVSGKPTGTLVVRDLRSGRRLFLLATGTGVAPFMGIVKDPETYERFAEVFLVRGARTVDGLGYADAVLEELRRDPYLGDLAGAQLHDFATVTREPYRHRGRITTLIDSGALWAGLGVPALDPAADRVMICGNMRMIDDLTVLLESRGFKPSPRVGVAGDYVIERAFVDAHDGAGPEGRPLRADAALG